mmetsp:Transcript_39826/g.66222  ORF Transcript_39826/g.66222 Transcript_39826/m.66222 type:complete len:88 (-) Transcript_39826:171-434(-)
MHTTTVSSTTSKSSAVFSSAVLHIQNSSVTISLAWQMPAVHKNVFHEFCTSVHWPCKFWLCFLSQTVLGPAVVVLVVVCMLACTPPQ